MISIEKQDGIFNKVEVWANGITKTTSQLTINDIINILISKGILREDDIK